MLKKRTEFAVHNIFLFSATDCAGNRTYLSAQPRRERDYVLCDKENPLSLSPWLRAQVRAIPSAVSGRKEKYIVDCKFCPFL